MIIDSLSSLQWALISKLPYGHRSTTCKRKDNPTENLNKKNQAFHSIILQKVGENISYCGSIMFSTKAMGKQFHMTKKEIISSDRYNINIKTLQIMKTMLLPLSASKFMGLLRKANHKPFPIRICNAVKCMIIALPWEV